MCGHLKIALASPAHECSELRHSGDGSIALLEAVKIALFILYIANVSLGLYPWGMLPPAHTNAERHISASLTVQRPDLRRCSHVGVLLSHYQTKATVGDPQFCAMAVAVAVASPGKLVMSRQARRELPPKPPRYTARSSALLEVQFLQGDCGKRSVRRVALAETTYIASSIPLPA